MTSNQIIVEVSARHIHLTQKDWDTLFGVDYKARLKRELSQSGEFACEDRVSIVGPRNTIKNVVVLFPPRKNTQVEISATDAKTLGIAPVLCDSGYVDSSPGCVLVGPYGELELKSGVMIARRHIHMTPADAEKFNVKDRDCLSVQITQTLRPLVFHDVLVRVNENFKLRMHIDTDEANAALINSCNCTGEILPAKPECKSPVFS